MVGNPFTRKKRRSDIDEQEREKIARLEQAEGELVSLKARAARAVRILEERRSQNGWKESIEQMIQGGI